MKKAPIQFTGEFFVPGQTGKKTEDNHLERYKFAARFVNGMNVLDIACGSGYGSKLLSASGAIKVTGVDIFKDVIEHAKSTYRGGNLFYETGDICEYKSASLFDVIVSFETIEHVEDHREALLNMFSQLKRGGTLIISTPNRLITSPGKSFNGKPKNRFHVREFTADEFCTALKDAGFQVDHANIFGQRQQKYFSNRLIGRIYKNVFLPNKRTSPVVDVIGELMPRYFVIVAKKD